MKKNIIHLIGICLLLNIYSCKQNLTNIHVPLGVEIKEGSKAFEHIASFESDTTYGFEVVSPAPDTFKLVSHNWYFWYPFGKFSNPKELISHYSNWFTVKEEIYPSLVNSLEVDTLYRVQFSDGFIKFYHTTWDEGSEKNDMAIVYASITQPVIQMTNGLRVGLTRDEANRILFDKKQPRNIRSYNNIMIRTVLDGIWVHLNFEEDRLNKIIIDTDYRLSKK
jgi:hypothetical protein